MAIPELRFKANDGSDYPDWEEKKLGEVVNFLDGQRKPLESGQRISGPYPYYGASGIIDYVNDYIFDDELILLSEDGANIIDRNYRVSFLARGKYWVNNHAHVLKAINGNVNNFICEQLETFDYRKYNSGGAQPKLNQATCRSLILQIPDIEEQQKIAAFFSNLDDVISASEAEVAALEKQKKGVMQKIFSQEVRFKKDDGSDYPDWEEKKFGNICKTYSGGTPKSGEPLYYMNGTIAFIRSGEIHDNKTELFITEEGLINSSAKMVDIGDILYALYGATSGEVDISKIKGAINQAILCIQPVEQYNKKYIVEILSFYKDYILRTYLQGGQGNLSAQIVQSLIFEFPCFEEQQKIADCLLDFDTAISLAKKELEKWKLLKKGLLQQMFV